ncbi:hypothetical protein [Streptomyces sp. NPDC059743]|uniref:hypothetical protein n=1 Tax=Streptomyces sp. NPDC059743 TaxID=3346928 RepID=UPI00364F3FF5
MQFLGGVHRDAVRDHLHELAGGPAESVGDPRCVLSIQRRDLRGPLSAGWEAEVDEQAIELPTASGAAGSISEHFFERVDQVFADPLVRERAGQEVGDPALRFVIGGHRSRRQLGESDHHGLPAGTRKIAQMVHRRGTDWCTVVLGRRFPGIAYVPGPDAWMLVVADERGLEPPLPQRITDSRREFDERRAQDHQRRDGATEQACR